MSDKKIKLYNIEMIETINVDVTYVVEAANPEEAKKKALIGDTLEEHDREDGEVINREIFEFVGEIPEEEDWPARYAFDFTDKEITEIDAVIASVSWNNGATRADWMLLANALIGKAARITRGDFEMDGDFSVADASRWADELNAIANKILAEFKPGDGKI